MKKIASVDERIRTRVSGSKVRRSNHQTTRPKTFLGRKKWYIKEKCILLLKPSTINLQFNFLKGPSIEYFKLNIFQTSMNQAFRKCIATFWALKLRLCYYSQGNCVCDAQKNYASFSHVYQFSIIVLTICCASLFFQRSNCDSKRTFFFILSQSFWK